MDRPQADEYAPYYDTYVSKVPDAPVFDTLRAQLEETRALLAGVSEAEGATRYAPEKWSVKEVLGHVVDVERIFATRGLAFARRDPIARPGMDQDEYVGAANFDARTVGSLIGEFTGLRHATVALFESMPEEISRQRGIASDCEFSVRAIVYILAGHERHHIDVLRDRYGLTGGER
jgi:hypothetical protein